MGEHGLHHGAVENVPCPDPLCLTRTDKSAVDTDTCQQVDIAMNPSVVSEQAGNNAWWGLGFHVKRRCGGAAVGALGPLSVPAG